MITATGLRWNIEDDNEAGKDQLGLDAYQVRKWDPCTATSPSACSPTPSSPSPEPAWEKTCAQPDDAQPRTPNPLIGYSLAAIRGLLAAATLAHHCLDWGAATTRDLWRRVHQTRAKSATTDAAANHYQRPLNVVPGLAVLAGVSFVLTLGTSAAGTVVLAW